MTNKKLTNEEVTKILKEAIDVIDSQQTKIVILKDYNEALIAEIRKLTRSTRKLKEELEGEKNQKPLKSLPRS